MLAPTARRFAQVYPGIEKEGHLKGGYSITYGNYSSRVKAGLKVRDATLYYYGKPAAWYDAATDEIYS
jgi:hypothetical protein